MQSFNTSGVFGKLPAHGDFVFRNLPNSCISVWDEWLQSYIAGSQEHLRDGWLDLYLSSPIWRFALSEGVLNEMAWIGVLIPSVDRVGRYFPLTVLTQIPAGVSLFEAMLLQSDWFQQTEELMLDSLEETFDIDTLFREVEVLTPEFSATYLKEQLYDSQKNAVVKMEFEEQSPSAVFPQLLDVFLTASLSSFSVWSTSGSDQVEPCTMVTQGLPRISSVPAMLDGQWNGWGWQNAYRLNALQPQESTELRDSYE
ncbi:type VI secretion system-associated protein TagF [Aliikangiella sp. G2MR2-5]|uniref:type VI secretion system-associated protein TagF n=1 Tax=Aliikangiella sp. G2MR2-5 TaxID=2788943 RepID=UPI0018AC25D2|nr:type VI secretion system-associated protein TagF [Aliikangiella sp. G2MR2-5]